MSPWHWDPRVVYNPLGDPIRDLTTIAATLAAAALLAAAATRRAPSWRPAGRCAALLVVALAAFTALWNWPIADDWAAATANRDLGPWRSVTAAYLGWTGRYTTYLIESLYGWLVSPTLGSVLWAWILLAAIVAGGYAALGGALRDSPGRRRLALAAALVGTAAWIVVQVWPGHGLYWFCATTTYAVGLALVLAMLAVATRAQRWPTAATVAAMLILGAACGGIGEIMPAAVLPVVAAWAVRAWWRRLPSRWAWTCAGAAMLAGLVANACSPGTAARHQAIEDGAAQAIGGFDHLPLAGMLLAWGQRSFADAWAWLAHPVLVCAAVAAVPFCGHLGRRLGWDRRPGWGEAAVAWLLAIGVVFAGYLPSYAIFNHAPPWRARDALQGLVIILGLIAWCRTLAACRAAGLNPWRCALMAAAAVALAGVVALLATPRSWPMQCTLAVTAGCGVAALLAWRRGGMSAAAAGWLLAAALLLGGSLPLLLADAVWIGPRWRAAHAVEEALITASAPRPARFPRIAPEDRPQHLWYWSPGSDMGHWINRAVAGWYRSEGVGIWP